MHNYTHLKVAAIAAALFQNGAAFAPPPRVPTPPRLRRSALRPVLVGSISRRAPPPLCPPEEKRRRGRGKRHRPPALRSAQVGDQEKEPARHYVRPYLKQLFLLCRPVNFPIVALFHVLGVHQATQLWASSTASPSRLLPLLRHPCMLMVLLSLLLVTSTSMITNDYYDARNGVDAAASATDDGENDYHPLARGEVPFSIAKTFDSYLYALLLVSSAFVPGILPRLMVLGGAIITYLYTVHLKPRTWIKNLSCAALVAMSPVTSGLAAWQVLCDGNAGVGGVASVSSSSIPFHLIFGSPLAFLVASLFAGIMSREILMDITDCEGDAQAGIETVPVRYGKSVASRVALGCSFTSAIAACWASLIPWMRRFTIGGESLKNLIVVPTLSSLTTLLTNSQARKVLLAAVGSGMLLQRTFIVWKTEGDDVNLCERAIRESLLSVLLVLASFL